ncbi:HNH endonuclease [Peribacillus loiseleuriae]|uniref:HNH endonuclease n=1 Tax=Peribacillus loiseleuriae TaxID=1679170 RepID=UPI003CFFC708
MKSNIMEIDNYILVYRPDHPKAYKAGSYKGYIYEHILISELVLGRSLEEGEQVHHFNFNGKDNRKENLIVLHKAQHMKLHRLIEYYGLENIIKANSTKGHLVQACKNCYEYTLSDNKKFCCDDCKKEYTEKKKKEKPSKEELVSLLDDFLLAEISNSYNVSSKTLKKWIKEYEIA